MPPILSSFGGLAAIGRGQQAGGRKLVEITISANTNNYVLNTEKIPVGYEPGNTDVVLTISTGVVVGSASTGSFAFDVDASWNTSDTVKIVNNGQIKNLGGAGGAGGTYPNNYGGYAGGPALRAQRALLVDNANGVIAGGGGGGGGGPWAIGDCDNEGVCSCVVCNPPIALAGGAGGSGAGAQGSAVGGSAGSGPIITCPIGGLSWSGDGGSGGALGSAGGTSGSSYSRCEGTNSGIGGGAAGACTSGNSNITWLAAGIRYGALN